MKINVFSIIFILTIFSTRLSAQIQDSNVEPKATSSRGFCGSTEKYNEYIKDHPEVLQLREQLEQFTRQYIKGHPNEVTGNAVKIIPVVFHVLHNYGPENIPDESILEQMRVWNDDFRKLSADTSDIASPFKSIAADCQIEFRLATLDPSGNCTNGIDRIPTLYTYNADDYSKLNPWPSSEYFNIWTAASLAKGDGVLAYAQFPGTGSPSTDGVMTLSGEMGTRTITHEAGHCFNLYHTWDCCTEVGTACGDDQVGDTPKTKGTFSCNVNQSVCIPPNIENIQNFMDYSACPRMFTQGQNTRMQACLNSSVSSRNNLWTPSNLIATGTADPYVVPLCAPVADFHASRQIVCLGDSVIFTDDSWKGHPTSWNWTFNGGIPSTSSDSAPSVRYNTPGNYAVTLITSNGSGSNSKSKSGYITVIDSTPYQVPFMEGFEGTFPPAKSVLQTPNGGPSWQRATTGHNSSYSLKMTNYNSSIIYNGSVAEYITPAYSFVNVTSPKVFFDLAYALKSTDTTLADGVKVYYSLNCGHGWVQRYSKSGSALVTSTPRSNFSFTPTANDWRNESVSVGSILSGKPNVRFRFEGVNGNGNNIYIDNININGTVAVEEDMAVSDFEIYPNPAKDYSTVEISLAKNTEVRMELFDIAGRKIATIVNGRMLAGTHRFPLNQQLQDGVYFVNMTSGMATTSKRLVILQ